MDSFDFKKYINMALKRKWWIILPFLITVLGGFTYFLITPKVYEAQTLILVQQQKVPENYVQSTVSTSLDDRIRTISEQVTSRTNLETIIKDYGLYESAKKDMLMDDKIEDLRKMITIASSKNTGRTNTTSSFTINFRNEDPKKAMDVANALGSNFRSENLKIREEQAQGTSTFLSDELLTIEDRLKKKEEELKAYRERYMGGLPEQLQTNMSILERLNTNLNQLNTNLIDAENRRTSILKDIAASRETLPAPSSSSDADKQPTDLAALKSQLASLESRYTPNHPDVIRLRETIAAMEKERADALAKSKSNGDEGSLTSGSSVDQALNRQAIETAQSILGIKAKIEETSAQIKQYQAKVEETPKREQELLSLNRDYANTKESYDSLLKRKLEAEISVSMEKKQKGEQLKIIDFAQMPEKPVAPDEKKIILMTLAIGLGLGIGLAYLMETMDTSYRTPDDAEKDIQLPVLVSFPLLMTEAELRRIKRNSIFAYTGVTIGFIISAAGILIAVKGMGGSITLLKGIFLSSQ